MKKAPWTFMVVPGPDRQVRTLRMSPRSLRGAALVFGILVASLLIFSVGFFMKLGEEVQRERLVEENKALRAHLQRTKGQLAELAGALEELRRRDEQYRLLAGLPSLDADVERVGIGGPGTEALEASSRYAHSPALGEQIFSTTYDLNTLLRRARLLNASFAEATRAMEDHRERLQATPSIAPAPGWLASLFSYSRAHPILNVPRPHEGIDISAARGTPIMAAAAGTVTYVGWRPGFGLTVEVDHGYGYRTRYAHCEKILVRRGQRVERGTRIALVGNTGISIGPHLHYEILKDGRPLDPLSHMISELSGIPD